MTRSYGHQSLTHRPGPSEQSQELVKLARQLGWEDRELHNGVVLLTRPHYPNSIAIPPHTSWNVGKYRHKRNTIITHGDPDLRALFLRSKLGAEEEGHGTRLDAGLLLEAANHDINVEVVARGQLAHATRELSRIGPPVVTEILPWMARSHKTSGNRVDGHESPAAAERHWSDGHIDYVCKGEDCDFFHDTVRSVTSHYGAKHIAKPRVTRQSRERARIAAIEAEEAAEEAAAESVETDHVQPPLPLEGVPEGATHPTPAPSRKVPQALVDAAVDGFSEVIDAYLRQLSTATDDAMRAYRAKCEDLTTTEGLLALAESERDQAVKDLAAYKAKASEFFS